MGGESIAQAPIQFYDPFVPEAGQEFDPLTSLEATFANYREEKVSDEVGALDRLAIRVESLFMDAHFLGRFNELQAMADRVHRVCGENHGVMQRFGATEYLSGFIGDQQTQTRHEHGDQDHHHEDDEDEDEEDGKKRKPTKHIGWLTLGHKY